MTRDQAIRIIKQLHYKPGWTFEIRPYPFVDELIITMNFETFDTNVRYAPDYRQTIRPGPTFTLRPSDFNTRRELEDHLMNTIIELEVHEAREAFKRREPSAEYGYVAPYHPHRADGDMAWRRLRVARGDWQAQQYAIRNAGLVAA
jgi:hypothetical protein